MDRVRQLVGANHKADAPSPSATAKDDRPKPGFVGALKEVASEFSKDDGMTQAAALAFYTGLAIAPMLSIAVWMTQIFVGTSKGATDQIKAVASQVIGSAAAQPIDQLIGPASSAASKGNTVTGIVSIIFLAISASGVFGQLQSSLNIMWSVKADPKSSSGIWSLVRKRLFSFGMLFTLLFLMLVSMLATFVLEAAGTYLKHRFGGDAGGHGALLLILQAVNLAVTFGGATFVFALLFKYLPDVHVPWRDVVFGAAVTALLFMIGKYALGLYLGRGSYESSYGAAIGSFVALLVWVYYTSVIIFIGAETTEVYARRNGHEPTAEPHAVKTQRVEKKVEAAPPLARVTYGATVPTQRAAASAARPPSGIA